MNVKTFRYDNEFTVESWVISVKILIFNFIAWNVIEMFIIILRVTDKDRNSQWSRY